MKKDIFLFAGRVHPNEYDWKKQFSSSKLTKAEDPYVPMDVGKVLGLCAYIEELEKILSDNDL